MKILLYDEFLSRHLQIITVIKKDKNAVLALPWQFEPEPCLLRSRVL